MNEEEKKLFDENTAVASNAIPDSNLNDDQKLQLIQAMTSNTVLADIARQLTRLADLAEPTHLIMGQSEPAPDVPTAALVEAVKDIDWDGEIEQAPKRMDGDYTDDSHEKSVYHFGLRDGLLEAKKIVEIALWPANRKTAISKQPNVLMDLLKDIEKYLQGKKSGQSFEESDLVGRIQSALATHEKAVRHDR